MSDEADDMRILREAQDGARFRHDAECTTAQAADRADAERDDVSLFENARRHALTAKEYGAIDLEKVFAEMRAANPVTGACEACGEDVTRDAKLCFECNEKRRREQAAVRSALWTARHTIPAGFAFCAAGFDDPKVTACVRDGSGLSKVKANALADSWLLLRGPAGSGKSVCAAVTGYANAQRGIAPTWISAIRTASVVQRSSLGEEPTEVRDAIETPLLIVDDLGSESLIPSSPIVEILHARHEQGRRTIVTTWIDLARTRERYGDGIARRLHERASVVEFKPQQGGSR